MSSLPEDTKEETELVGEGGVQGAGIRDAASMVDRLKPRLEITSGVLASLAAVEACLRTLRASKFRSRASKPSLS